MVWAGATSRGKLSVFYSSNIFVLSNNLLSNSYPSSYSRTFQLPKTLEGTFSSPFFSAKESHPHISMACSYCWTSSEKNGKCSSKTIIIFLIFSLKIAFCERFLEGKQRNSVWHLLQHQINMHRRQNCL